MSTPEPSDTGSAEPDYRFTLANERTFLAHIRTSLAFLAGGVALTEASDSTGAQLVAVIAVGVGALLGVSAYPRWRRTDAAIRAGQPMPVPRSLAFTSGAVGVLAVAALGLIISRLL